MTEPDTTASGPTTLEKLKDGVISLAIWGTVIGSAAFGFGAGKEWVLDQMHAGDKSSIVCHQGNETVFEAKGY
jgi:hypothetical protein